MGNDLFAVPAAGDAKTGPLPRSGSACQDIPRALCEVFQRLAGTWGEGSLRTQKAIDNANQEVGRGALDMTPACATGCLSRSRATPRGRVVGQAYTGAYRTAFQQGVMRGECLPLVALMEKLILPPSTYILVSN